MAFRERAASNVCQEDVMIPRIDMLLRSAFEMTHSALENRHAFSGPLNFESFESSFARLEAARKVPQHGLVTLWQKVQDELRASK